MHTRTKIVAAITGLLLVGGMFAAGAADAATYSDQCTTEVAGPLSLRQAGTSIGPCVDGVGGVSFSNSPFIGVDGGVDNLAGVFAGGAFSGTDHFVVAGAQTSTFDTGVVSFKSGPGSVHFLVCPNGAQVPVNVYDGEVTPPSPAQIAACVG